MSFSWGLLKGTRFTKLAEKMQAKNQAETQPKLRPALLRSSALASQYLTREVLPLLLLHSNREPNSDARPNERYCAVNPKKIPYGSKVVFHDAECLAVDTGPDVVNRKAARCAGETNLNVTRSLSIVFLRRKKRRLPGQKRIHIL